MTASRLIYAAAGAPVYPGMMAGICRLCGANAIGAPWQSWVKDTFTGHDQLWPGALVCHACLFCADDHNAVLTARTGRDKPQRMRNYSHIITPAGRWLPLMKHQKRALISALLDADDPPLVAVVSLAGQKHLVMRARVGWWQVEESSMRPDPVRIGSLLPPIEALYDAGATKGMIASGDYSLAFLRTGLDIWRNAEPMLRSARGSAAFALAVWLSQKAELHDGDARSSDELAPADLGRHQSGVQEQVPDDHLASVRRSRPERGVYDDAEPVSQPDLFAAERDAAR